MPSRELLEIETIVAAIEDCDYICYEAAAAIVNRIPRLSEFLINCPRCESYRRSLDSRIVDGVHWCSDCAYSYAFRWEDGNFHEFREDSSSVPGYHETSLTIPENILEKDNILGIELETYQSSIKQCSKKLRELRKEWENGIKYERDDSIDDDYGVEIVARPFTLEEIRNKESSPWHEICEWSNNNGGQAWKTSDNDGDYGMHISLNASKLSEAHQLRISRFVNNNKVFCSIIAGRTQNACTMYRHKNGSPEDDYEDKYQAACIRDGRIEIRIFRASLHWDRFVRNCEFVDALRVFTKNCCNTSSHLSENAFRAWMLRNGNSDKYPLLAKVVNNIEEFAEVMEVE